MGLFSWCGVNGIITSVQEIERARKGVGVLMNNEWHSAVIDFGCVSFRFLWVNSTAKEVD